MAALYSRARIAVRLNQPPDLALLPVRNRKATLGGIIDTTMISPSSKFSIGLGVGFGHHTGATGEDARSRHSGAAYLALKIVVNRLTTHVGVAVVEQEGSFLLPLLRPSSAAGQSGGWQADQFIEQQEERQAGGPESAVRERGMAAPEHSKLAQGMVARLPLKLERAGPFRGR